MAAANNTAAAKALKLQRQAAALEFRRAGLDFREIGRRLNCSKSQAQRDVAHALEEAKAAVLADATDLKAEDLDRLNALLTTLWVKRSELGAIDRILAVMQRRAKLMGLDAPVKLAHAGPGGGPIPLRNDGIDLDKLTDQQLEQYEALVRASLAASAPAGEGRPGVDQAET